MGRTSTAKEKLIDSAVKLITNRSYHSVGVQELCDHAGIKKGSFYHFFPSKKELTITCLDEMWNFYKSKVLEPITTSDLSLNNKIDNLVSESYKLQLSIMESEGCIVGCPFGNLALEMSTQDEDIRVKIKEVFIEWSEYFRIMIDKAIEKGELPTNTNSLLTAKSLIAYIEGLSLIGKTFNDPELVKSLGCVLKSIAISSDCN